MRLELAVHVATPLSPPVECLESLFSTSLLFVPPKILSRVLVPKMRVLTFGEALPFSPRHNIYGKLNKKFSNQLDMVWDKTKNIITHYNFGSVKKSILTLTLTNAC